MKKVIKYRFLSCEVNHGTPEKPNIEQILLDKEIRCDAADLETYEAIAKREAYNGEYTIEDDIQSGTEIPESGTDVWDELDAAYQEGVNTAYDQ